MILPLILAAEKLPSIYSTYASKLAIAPKCQILLIHGSKVKALYKVEVISPHIILKAKSKMSLLGMVKYCFKKMVK